MLKTENIDIIKGMLNIIKDHEDVTRTLGCD